MDVSEVDGAADKQLVSEALDLIWGMLDDLVMQLDNIEASEYAESLSRRKTLAALIG